MNSSEYGYPIRGDHQICIKAVQPLITTGNESLLEVIEWMDEQSVIRKFRITAV